MTKTAQEVRCLIIPGLYNSGPGHWQTAWEETRTDCVRVDLGDWHDPRPIQWVSHIDRAVALHEGPLVLAAHSLGCLAVAWWAAHAREQQIAKVAGALLVAPPDVGRPDADTRLRRFAPLPTRPFGFSTTLVASRNDPYSPFEKSVDLATLWRAKFVDAGSLGHINSASGLGDWTEGQDELDRLIAGAENTWTTSANELIAGQRDAKPWRFIDAAK